MIATERTGDFKYFVGVRSLAEVATRDDRVCVLNILGGESSGVTPVGHAYSGGNVVFGTSPGRRGQVLSTACGDIPVYNNVLEGLEAGHRFNCGVVYLPPSAADDGVVELIRVNPELRKIFIPTEKMSVHDAREIRALAQLKGIDIFGGNSLGVADAWNRVRIGGALGGDDPAGLLQPGSIAILSNSGGFTTTIAQYLRMAGWGTTTLISSGKDVYIHFAAPEFAHALGQDDRSQAAVLYCEPGGYYERDAHFTKPVVACVVGRWKSRLTRAVGHAGALAGGGDDACAKERWFMEKFGVDSLFTPEHPVHSARGAVVTNIADIPAALTLVMRANGVQPDFPAQGTMELKPWFGASMGLPLPADLDLPTVQAPEGYREQIAQLDTQLGAVLPRRSMRNASGASQMDDLTQVTRLHGVSMLACARQSFESNIALALLREPSNANTDALIAVAIAARVPLHGQEALRAAQASREQGNTPNTVLAAAACALGTRSVASVRAALRVLLTLFAGSGLRDGADVDFDATALAVDSPSCRTLWAAESDPAAERLLQALAARGARSAFLRLLSTDGRHPTADAVHAAIVATVCWGPLVRKRISRIAAESMASWLHHFGTLIGAAAPASRHQVDAFCGESSETLVNKVSVAEMAYRAVMDRAPGAGDLFIFETLLGLLLSNGPGTLTAQGAKGAVSADGPQAPARVQLNKALVGFLTHAGHAHGGNGFEGVAFLLEAFRDITLTDAQQVPSDVVRDMARRYAQAYATRKSGARGSGDNAPARIPGVNHPVFKDKPINSDPREAFIRQLLAERGEGNVFLDFYHVLVEALHECGASRVVYCVNIDAAIAALLLRLAWGPVRSGGMSEQTLETAAFTVFLFARMVGCAAEIDDHLDRGRDMDMRVPASECEFVA